MMKKILTVFFIAVLLFAAVSCKQGVTPDFAPPTHAIENTPETTPELPKRTPKPYSNYNNMLSRAEIVSGMAMYTENFYKESLGELEAASGIIVLGTVKSKQTIDDEESMARGSINGTTVATIEIEKVFNSTEKWYPLNPGDQIEVQEYCYLYERSDGNIQLNTYDYYLPVKEYETYLFFLEIQKNYQTEHSAKYTPVSLWYGKYPVNTDVANAKENNFINCGKLELACDHPEDEVPMDIRILFDEVYEKYYTDKSVQAVLELQHELK